MNPDYPRGRRAENAGAVCVYGVSCAQMTKGKNSKTGQDMCALGRMGGRANKGKEATREKCAAAGRAFWSKLTTSERSDLARARAIKAWATRRKNQAKTKSRPGSSAGHTQTKNESQRGIAEHAEK